MGRRQEEVRRASGSIRESAQTGGAPPEYHPLDGDPENGQYVVKMGDWGPRSTCWGKDIAYVTRAMGESYRDDKFEKADAPMSVIHTRCHQYLARYGIQTHESKYSKMAPTSDDSSWESDKNEAQAQEIRAVSIRADAKPEPIKVEAISEEEDPELYSQE